MPDSGCRRKDRVKIWLRYHLREELGLEVRWSWSNQLNQDRRTFLPVGCYNGSPSSCHLASASDRLLRPEWLVLQGDDRFCEDEQRPRQCGERLLSAFPPFVSTKHSARRGSRYRHDNDASSMPACVGGRDT